MKIIKQGAVRVARIYENTQSLTNVAKMYHIHTLCYDMDATIGGKKKIQIYLRDKAFPDEPTILSTGDDWTAFNQDDAIKVMTRATHGDAIVVYFNMHNMKQILIGPDVKRHIKHK